MLKTSSYVNPQLANLIKQIASEQSQFDRELRSVPREKMVLPVAIRLTNGFPAVNAFTRNLSMHGMSVIAEIPFREKVIAKAQIHRLGFEDENANEILCECRWSKTFGMGFWVSGWRFLRRAE